MNTSFPVIKSDAFALLVGKHCCIRYCLELQLDVTRSKIFQARTAHSRNIQPINRLRTKDISFFSNRPWPAKN